MAKAMASYKSISWTLFSNGEVIFSKSDFMSSARSLFTRGSGDLLEHEINNKVLTTKINKYLAKYDKRFVTFFKKIW